MTGKGLDPFWPESPGLGSTGHLVDIVKIQENALDWGLGPFSIPDLFLASLAIRNNFSVFSLDRHFEDLSHLTDLTLWPNEGGAESRPL